jgi:hypothetical protein
MNEWYENALVNVVLNDDFVLNFYDVSRFHQVEVDTTNDFITAREIYGMGKIKNE